MCEQISEFYGINGLFTFAIEFIPLLIGKKHICQFHVKIDLK